jgi:hypothetical protein
MSPSRWKIRNTSIIYTRMHAYTKSTYISLMKYFDAFQDESFEMEDQKLVNQLDKLFKQGLAEMNTPQRYDKITCAETCVYMAEKYV